MLRSLQTEQSCTSGAGRCRQCLLAFACGVGSLLGGCRPSENLSDLENTASHIAKIPKATVTVKNYCPSAGKNYSDFILINMSGAIEQDKLLPDFDRDGVTNSHELESNATLGIDYRKASSTVPGYSDLTIYLNNFTIAQQQKFRTCAEPTKDTDGDGLTDCEENEIYHTDPDNSDSDGDGIPDGIELRSGMNPLDPHDAEQSTGGDGMSNYDKVKANLPLAESLTDFTRSMAFRYSPIPISGGASQCYNMTVENIFMTTVTNGNLLGLYFIEADVSGNKSVVAKKMLLTPSTHDGDIINVNYTDLESLGVL